MSHNYTHQEIDNAKIQVLQAKLGMTAIPFEQLYEQAIALLDGNTSDHIGDDGEELPEVEKYDE